MSHDFWLSLSVTTAFIIIYGMYFQVLNSYLKFKFMATANIIMMWVYNPVIHKMSSLQMFSNIWWALRGGTVQKVDLIMNRNVQEW